MPDSGNQSALTETVFYILLSLLQPLHGYGIIKNVEKLSKGRLHMGPGTLYGAINSLLEKGFIKFANQQTSSRKKEYIITEEGIWAIKQELIRLKELLDNGISVMNQEGRG